MTMQFKCNTCGVVTDVPQFGAEGASCVEPSTPPKGWRTIWTMIEESLDGHGKARRHESEVLHSCADCNVHMDVDEHLEAEFEGRKRAMWQPRDGG